MSQILSKILCAIVKIPILPGHLTRILSFIFLSHCNTIDCAHTMLIDKNLVVRRKSANWCVLQGSPHQRKQKEPGSRKRVWFWIWWHCRIWILNDWKVSFISSLSWSSSWSSSSSSSSTWGQQKEPKQTIITTSCVYVQDSGVEMRNNGNRSLWERGGILA